MTEAKEPTGKQKALGCGSLVAVLVVVGLVIWGATGGGGSKPSAAAVSASAASASAQMVGGKVTADEFAATMLLVDQGIAGMGNGSMTVQNESDAVAQAKPMLADMRSTMLNWPEGDGTRAWTAAGDAQKVLSDLSAFLDSSKPSDASAFKEDWAQMAADWNPVAAKYWPKDKLPDHP